MKVKVLNGILPKKGRDGDAAFDLYSPEEVIVKSGERYKIKLGICIQIDEFEVALVQERSGMAFKNGIETIGNVIDSNYRGEISCILLNTSKEDFKVKIGDRISQLLILKLGNQYIEEVDNLDESNRGENGFGSSGK